jgi:hypothetical protein
MQGHSRESYFPLRVEARGTQLNTKAGNNGVRTSSVMCPNGRILEIRIDLNDVAQGHMTLLVPLPTYFRVSFRINGLDDTIFLDIGLIMCYY